MDVKKNDKYGGWIAPPAANANSQFRLFCFPYAGSNGQVFKNWASTGSSVMEICPVLLPGRGQRRSEPLVPRLQPMVEEMAKFLPLEKPFAFFGHSLGSILAFELARELKRRHLSMPKALFVSAFAAPHLISPAGRESFHSRTDADLIQELRQSGNTPPEILQDPRIMEMLIPVFRADCSALEAYVYTPDGPLNCPIKAFGGKQDPSVSVELLIGWKEYTSSSFELKLFQGDHFYLYKHRLPILLEVTRTMADAAEASG